jgi:hypothetical protein
MKDKLPAASYVFCGQKLFDNIVNGYNDSVEGTSSSLVWIELIENPVTRKARAIVQSMTTGLATLYEDDQGNILKVSMPKAGPVFPCSPFSAMRKP